MRRAKRFFYRLSEVLDYRTFVVATGFLALTLAGYLIVASLQQAHDATQSAQQRGKAATRRIDKLNDEISQLQADIAQGRDQRGQLAAAVAVLAKQLATMGVEPIVRVSPGTTVILTSSPEPAPSPAASPSAPRPTASPRPSPTRTGNPRPTASPTPCFLPLLCKAGS